MNASTTGAPLEKTFFEEQREMLVLEIAQVNSPSLSLNPSLIFLHD